MSSEQAPGLISGHAKLASGIVSSTIGSVTGSESWTQSGNETKQAGISELKEYQDQNPPSGEGNSTAASLESKLGSAVGCEGLVKDGDATTGANSTGTSSSTIGSDGDAKGSIPGGIGADSLPGKSTGGADPAAGSIGDMPGNKIV